MQRNRLERHLAVAFASIVGSFVVYGADLACGGVGPTVAQVPSAPASSSSSSSTANSASIAATPAPSTCGCSGSSATTKASFVVAGDEKMSLDPTDATADVDVRFVRGAGGKKLAEVSAVVRAFRLDVPSERPTTIAIRVKVPEGGGVVAAKDVEAYVTTWTATGAVTARAYATVAKASLTVSIVAETLEIKGSIALKDVPTSRAITVDSIAIRKTGAAFLPARSGAFAPP